MECQSSSPLSYTWTRTAQCVMVSSEGGAGENRRRRKASARMGRQRRKQLTRCIALLLLCTWRINNLMHRNCTNLYVFYMLQFQNVEIALRQENHTSFSSGVIVSFPGEIGQSLQLLIECLSDIQPELAAGKNLLPDHYIRHIGTPTKRTKWTALGKGNISNRKE